MQRVHFAVVAPNVIEIFDTEVRLRVDDVRVSAPPVSLPTQLSLRLSWIEDELISCAEIDREAEAELCEG